MPFLRFFCKNKTIIKKKKNMKRLTAKRVHRLRHERTPDNQTACKSSES